MKTDLSGAKLQTIKQINRGMVLQLILKGIRTNRTDISKELNLTRTTLTNIVTELMEDGVIAEVPMENKTHTSSGRKSITLDLSKDAPLICGVMLLRKRLVVALADMKCNIVQLEEYSYQGVLPLDEMKKAITDMYSSLERSTKKKIAAVGISAVGPVDVHQGLILNPHRFYQEDQDFPVVSFMEELTELPCFLSHDVSAGAIAEHLYGNATYQNNFVYISIIHGLGAGLFLNSQIFDGETGQNGELGHISIDFQGELCDCGQRGCVERYLDFERMQQKAKQYQDLFPEHPVFTKESIDFFDIVMLADEKDTLALLMLDEYCTHLSNAISNLISPLGVNSVYISNMLEAKNQVFLTILENKLNSHLPENSLQTASVQNSHFGLQASLYGAFSIIMNKVFNGELYFRSK